LRPSFARRWPALARSPWFPALGDGACSNIGAGATGPGRAAIMIGTSGAIRVMHPARAGQPPWGLWVYRADHHRALTGGALSNGGNVFEWLEATLRLSSVRRLEQTLAAMPPDGHRLTMLPLLAGERSPGWADHATGALTGITLHTRPLEILQAGMEGICYRFGLLERMLGRALPGRRQLIATGAGLLRSQVWMQMLADVLGKPLTPSGEPEGSSRGAALMALEALGYVPTLEAAPARMGKTIRARPAHHAVYRHAIARQQALYHELIGP
jgi:gluconokinase